MLEAWLALDLAGDILRKYLVPVLLRSAVANNLKVIILPISMLKPLLMKTSQKIELAIIFSLVLVNMVLTILRTVYSIDVDLMKFPDQNVLWYFLQVTISVIVCALPCYRGLLARKRGSSIQHLNRFGSGSSEFAEIWQRYLVSIGEQTPEMSQGDVRRTQESGSTANKYTPPGTAI